MLCRIRILFPGGESGQLPDPRRDAWPRRRRGAIATGTRARSRPRLRSDHAATSGSPTQHHRLTMDAPARYQERQGGWETLPLLRPVSGLTGRRRVPHRWARSRHALSSRAHANARGRPPTSPTQVSQRARQDAVPLPPREPGARAHTPQARHRSPERNRPSDERPTHRRPRPTTQVDVGLSDQVTVAPPQIGGIPLAPADAGVLASRIGDAPADPAQVGSRTRPSHARTRTRASDGRPYDAGLATSWAGHTTAPSARAWSSGAHAAGLPPRARAQAPLRSPATRVAGGVARSRRDDEPE